MKKFIFSKIKISIFFIIILKITIINAKTNSNDYYNEIAVGWNTLLIGNAISLEINRNILNHLAIGLNIMTGNIAFQVEEDTVYLGTYYEHDMNLNIQINHIYDLYLNLYLSKKRMQFFNSYKIGISHMNILYENYYIESNDPSPDELWTAKKNFSCYGLFLEVDFFKFYPKVTNNFGYSLGVNIHYFPLKDPVVVYEYNNKGSIRELRWSSRNSSYIHVFAPMLYFKMCYKF